MSEADEQTVLVATCRADPGAEMRRLLARLPGAGQFTDDADPVPGIDCAVLGWAQSGGMELTGPPDAPPTAPSAPVATRVAGALAALAAVTGRRGRSVRVDPRWLLSSRAASAGFRRGGQISANRSCRLLPGPGEEWIAVNLSRAQDVQVVCALDGGGSGDPWTALARDLTSTPVEELVELLQLLEVPAAVLGSTGGAEAVTVHAVGAPVERSERIAVVLDLSAMWAGPLCAHLLGRAGAQVVKVEDVNRPDGARFGPPDFFTALHRGHTQQQLDLSDPDGRDALLALADRADVVIESSRPRALAQLGLSAEDFLAARPGRTWISITGYGRRSPWANRVAFGDDAAVAGGLVAWDAAGRPVFCADALADPLAGVFAALAGAASMSVGGGHLVDVAMAGVSADVARAHHGPAYQHLIHPGRLGLRVDHDPVAAGAPRC